MPSKHHKHNPLDEVFSGILWKKHRKNQFWSGWHCRYFVLLRTGRLVYYKNKKKLGKPRGGVHLSSSARIVRGTKSTRHNFYRFEVYTANGQVVLLAGESEQYANQWVDQLERSVQASETSASSAGSGMEVSDVSDPEDEDYYNSGGQTGPEDEDTDPTPHGNHGNHGNPNQHSGGLPSMGSSPRSGSPSHSGGRVQTTATPTVFTDTDHLPAPPALLHPTVTPVPLSPQGNQGHQGHQGHQGTQGNQGNQGNTAATHSSSHSSMQSPMQSMHASQASPHHDRPSTPGSAAAIKRSQEWNNTSIKEGFLFRKPSRRLNQIQTKLLRIKSWHKRYFTLSEDGRLEWYKINYKRGAHHLDNLRGTVMMGSDCVVEFHQNKKVKGKSDQ